MEGFYGIVLPGAAFTAGKPESLSCQWGGRIAPRRWPICSETLDELQREAGRFGPKYASYGQTISIGASYVRRAHPVQGIYGCRLDTVGIIKYIEKSGSALDFPRPQIRQLASRIPVDG